MSEAVGVYAITCLPTGKQYIGSAAQSFRIRWNLHRSRLRRGIHHSRYLQRAWVKYGEDAFEFRVLVICRPVDAVFYEQRLVEGLSPEFNVSEVRGSGFGRSKTPEQRQAVSERLKREWADGRRTDVFSRLRDVPEYRQKLRAAAALRVARDGDVVRERARAQGLANSKRHVIHGESLTMREIAGKYGFKFWTIKRRIENGAVGEDVIAPLHPGHKRRAQ